MNPSPRKIILKALESGPKFWHQLLKTRGIKNSKQLSNVTYRLCKQGEITLDIVGAQNQYTLAPEAAHLPKQRPGPKRGSGRLRNRSAPFSGARQIYRELPAGATVATLTLPGAGTSLEFRSFGDLHRFTALLDGARA